MSAVDRAKGFRRRAVDRLYPHGIVVHHVPKCGGTSVGRAVRIAFLASQATIDPRASFRARATVSDHGDEWDEGELLHLREALLAYLLHSGVRAVAAHVPYSARIHDEVGDRYRFVVVLRDPVERWVSHYLWNNGRPGGHGYRATPLEQFLATQDAERLGSAYARYLCGEVLDHAELAGRGVDQAIANLDRLDAVGFTDDLPAFGAQLRRLTGKRVRIRHDNVGQAPARRVEILEGPHRARIEELCRPDLAVWEAAQRLR